jgi:hypothetical protein
MNRYSILLIALGLSAGCETGPPPSLTADDPASPSAPEAAVQATGPSLGADALTKKSREILAQATKERQQSDQSGPDAGDQTQGQGTAPMQSPQPQKTPGMQIPQEQFQPSPTPNN